MQMNGFIGLAESLLRQPDIAGTVFDKQNFYGHTISSDQFHQFLSLPARANRNVEPCPGSDSTEMLPPWRSTIFLQIANPMPVPANSSRLWSRWNMPKILSKYCGSMPRPLSFTENIHFFPPSMAAEMCIRGSPGFWYLMALPMRF